MKRTLSILLAVLMLATSFVFTASAEEASPIIFNLVENDGSIPYDQGRNGKCYFPKGSSTINPEVYTWSEKTKLTSEGGYAVFSAPGNGILEFDTFPADKAWKNDRKHTYIVLSLKTENAADGASVMFLSQGQKYKKSFPVTFTGEWQQIILNLNDTTGWYLKDNSSIDYSPVNIDGKQDVQGGFRIDLPGNSIGKTTIDYVGLFASEAQAKAYSGRQTVKSSEAYGTTEKTEDSVDNAAPEKVEIGESVLFNFVEPDGTIPFGKGRNGDCYFNKGSTTTNPEIYTWGSGVMVAENGYAAFYPGANNGMLELDTFPEDKAWTAKKNLSYIGFTVKTSAAVDTTITVVALGARYKKSFNVKYTGEWQRIVLDLNDSNGWYIKNSAGQYDAITYSPMKNPDGQQVMNGGMRLDFPGNGVVNSYTFDTFGIFGSIDAAKAYKLREEAKSTLVVPGTASTGTNTGASSGTTTPTEEEKVPEKPKMKDALTRGEKKVDDSITLVSAVKSSVVDEKKVIYKYSNIGAYDEAAKKYPVLDDEATSYLQTWNVGGFENTTSGILKYTSNANGATLFEAHTKKYANIKKHPYMVIGYKTNEDITDKSTVGFLYSSGNTYRIPLGMNPDGKWHYDIYNLATLDIQAKGEGNKYEVTTDRAGALDKIALGAFRIDFPVGKGVIYYIDYIGFFADEAEAKEYVALSEAAVNLDSGKSSDGEDKFTYMKGYDDGTFRPGAQMTRAEACTVVARLLADEDVIAKDRETKFSDVKKGDWYYSYVTYLEELGYLPNYSGEFKPNQNITRSEFIKLAFEAGGLEFSMKRPNYTDLNKSHPYYKEIVFASGTGIVTGYNNGDGTMSFKPDGQITRAEIATVVNRILKIEATPEAVAEFSDLDKSHWAFGTIMAIASKR